MTVDMRAGERTGWLELSSPGLDRPLVPAVERIARHLRAGAGVIALAGVGADFEALYRPDRATLGFTLPESNRRNRAAWALIGEWLVAWAAGAHDGSASLVETHSWFWRGRDVRPLEGAMQLGSLLKVVSNADEIRALLPYLLDPSSVATRRLLLSDHADHDERVSRKRAGTYYTPGDVAHHMIAEIIGAGAAPPTTWIDPANGSGVFLRAALTLANDFESTRSRLYGIDIDPFAAEATAFVLTAEDLLGHTDGGAPWERWHQFRRNLATGNTLFLDAGGNDLTFDLSTLQPNHPHGQVGSWRIEHAFPEIADKGFSRVVANPPYARLDAHPANRALPKLHPVTGGSVGADISPVFVEIGLNLLAADGAMSVVTPLSTVVSTRAPFPQLRSLLASQPGRIDFSSFDRMPDALFGDDIKTRNAIVHIDRAAEHVVTSSPLRRWTSRKRELALRDVPRTPVGDLPGVPALMPKIGTEWERQLYLAAARHGHYLRSLVVERRTRALSEAEPVDSGHWTRTIALAPTAYNFLGVTRDPGQAVRDGHDSQNAVVLLALPSSREASAAYALLASRFAFWLWHVTGDGFHTTSSLLSRLPVPAGVDAVDKLAELGDELWQRAQANPLVSLNRGRTTVSYPAWVFGEQIDRIDRQIDAMLGTDLGPTLSEWHEHLVVVDSDSNRVEKMRRKTK